MDEYRAAHKESCNCDRAWKHLIEDATDNKTRIVTETCATCGRMTWPSLVELSPRCQCFADQCAIRDMAKTQEVSFVIDVCPLCGNSTKPILVTEN